VKILCVRCCVAARSRPPEAPCSAAGSVGVGRLPVAAAVESTVAHPVRSEDGGHVGAGGGDPDKVGARGRVDSLPMDSVSGEQDNAFAADRPAYRVRRGNAGQQIGRDAGRLRSPALAISAAIYRS